jgi:hypothetical protein
MNCEEFLCLSEFDKSLYLASLIHVCQSDDSLFRSGADLIALGKRKGLFDGVKIFPQHISEPTGENTRTNKLEELP